MIGNLADDAHYCLEDTNVQSKLRGFRIYTDNTYSIEIP